MSSRKAPLDRDRVLDAAITLADRVGLEGLSMRRLAETVGVTPMALYKHVSSREDLIDTMVERIVSAFRVADGDTDWKREVRARILAARAVTTRHTWWRTAVETRTMAGPAVLSHMNALMEAMFRGGFSPDPRGGSGSAGGGDLSFGRFSSISRRWSRYWINSSSVTFTSNPGTTSPSVHCFAASVAKTRMLSWPTDTLSGTAVPRRSSACWPAAQR